MVSEMEITLMENNFDIRTEELLRVTGVYIL
jgi:hypothetical protein